MIVLQRIGGFIQRQGEALPPQIFLTLEFVVYGQKENYRNCCHLSDFKAKKAPNSISAPDPASGAPSAPQLIPSPLYRLYGLRNNLPPQIWIPKSAYAAATQSLPATGS